MCSSTRCQTFFDFYERGECSQAFRSVIAHPETTYEKDDQEEIEKRLINFIDASVFKTPDEAIETGSLLLFLMHKDPYCNATYIECANLLQYNLSFEWALFCNEEALIQIEEVRPELKLYRDLMEQEDMSPDDITRCIQLVEERSKKNIGLKLQTKQHWNGFQKSKREFCKSLNFNSLSFPHHVFVFPRIAKQIAEVDPETTCVFFFEAIENFQDEEIFVLHSAQTKIIVFHRAADFFQAFQFKHVAEVLCSSTTIIYILEYYPLDQFKHQKISPASIKKLQPIIALPRKGLDDILSTFLSLLFTCLTQGNQSVQEANWLYQMTREYLYQQDVQKYGRSRFFALYRQKKDADWFDCHKGVVPKSISIGPSSIDFLEIRVQENEKKRKRRAFSERRKKRVAHVTAQIIDGGHAPSNLVRSLLYHGDKEAFDFFLISTDVGARHSQEYPLAKFVSDSSCVRGKNTLFELEQRGIGVRCLDVHFSYDQMIQEVVSLLAEWEIDIVVFHGDDFIHSMSGSMCDVPARVFFDHGTLPKSVFFDQMVVSSGEAEAHCCQQYQNQSISVHCLPFSIDARAQWEVEAYSKQSLSLPEESFVMTTISNHLDARLSSEMCYAIAEILKRNSRAIYAPIGPVHDKEKFQEIFTSYGVCDRVRFLGSQSNPSQYVRSMHLYLNEFPFGSGLAILQAMAAGCPVVSMYNEEGPQQGRYGGVYFGKDRVISSLNVEEYIQLACNLIQDQQMYVEWSQHAVRQYEKRADVVNYVRTFESILAHSSK